MLNGGTFSAIPRQDGSFKLHAVPAGTYLLEVLDTQSLWPTVRLEVTPSGKPRAMLSHSRQPLPFPLPLEPLVAKPTFFEKREGFQWSQMLMNPMVLMMGVTLLLMVAPPVEECHAGEPRLALGRGREAAAGPRWAGAMHA